MASKHFVSLKTLSLLAVVCLFGATGSITSCSYFSDSSLTDQISALAKQEKNTEIVSFCDEKLKTDPNNSVLFASRGTAQLRLKHPDLAKADLEKAISLDGKVGWYHRELANVLAEQRNYKDALASFADSLRLDPDATAAAKTYAYQSNVYLQMDENAKAVASASEAIKLAPKGTFAGYAYQTRADAYGGLYENDDGLLDIAKAFELGQNFPSTYHARMKLNFAKGNYDKVLEDAKKLRSLDKEDLRGVQYEEVVALVNGDSAGGLKLADEMIKHFPDIANGYSDKASILFSQGDFKHANVLAEQALKLQPDNTGALGISAQLAAKAKDSKRTTELQERAVKLAPENSSITNAQALNLLFLGKYQEAVSLCDKLILKNEDRVKQANIGKTAKTPGVYRIRSEAYKLLKQNDKAESDMKTALAQGYRKLSMLELYLKQL